MKNKIFTATIYLSLFCAHLTAQNNVSMYEKGYIYEQNGHIMLPTYVTSQGDTILYSQLKEIEVSAPKSFANAEEYKRYQKYRYYAPTVVGYAVKAVKTYRELEVATREGSRRDRKKYINDLSDKMESEMREQLKNLTRTQGFLLIKMIERETHIPFYDLVKDVKGGFTAFYWQQFGKMYGYDLTKGYTRGEDILLDSILDQYDLRYYLY